LLKRRNLFMASFQLVVWDLGAEAVNMMKAYVT
jgi:hypothetical protein